MRLATAALLFCAVAGAASATVRTKAKVRYQTLSGQSDWEETTVTFATGMELMQLAPGSNVDGYTAYALVFFSRDRPTLIKSSNASMCGATFTNQCLPTYQHFEGMDQGGRAWEICTAAVCY